MKWATEKILIAGVQQVGKRPPDGPILEVEKINRNQGKPDF
jgi:hypothetical protein